MDWQILLCGRKFTGYQTFFDPRPIPPEDFAVTLPVRMISIAAVGILITSPSGS
jgi:hypothetical protein